VALPPQSHPLESPISYQTPDKNRPWRRTSVYLSIAQRGLLDKFIEIGIADPHCPNNLFLQNPVSRIF
jgi:hypothetical protein